MNENFSNHSQACLLKNLRCLLENLRCLLEKTFMCSYIRSKFQEFHSLFLKGILLSAFNLLIYNKTDIKVNSLNNISS